MNSCATISNLRLLRVLENDETIFDSPKPKLLDRVIYGLFGLLDARERQDRFSGCWPILDRDHRRLFKGAALKWLEELKKAGVFPIDVAIRRSFLEGGFGERLEAIITHLCNHIIILKLGHDVICTTNLSIHYIDDFKHCSPEQCKNIYNLEREREAALKLQRARLCELFRGASEQLSIPADTLVPRKERQGFEAYLNEIERLEGFKAPYQPSLEAFKIKDAVGVDRLFGSVETANVGKESVARIKSRLNDLSTIKSVNVPQMIVDYPRIVSKDNQPGLCPEYMS